MLARLKYPWTMTLAAVLLLAGRSFGQYRIADDGRYLDKSNRVGSSGYNDARAPYVRNYLQTQMLNNNIITGNVTGGREFRGPVGYRNIYEFRGPISSGGVDSFIRNSVGVAGAYRSAAPVQAPQSFYGRTLATAPPGAQELGRTGTYVSPLPSASAARQPFDARLDLSADLRYQLPPVRPDDGAPDLLGFGGQSTLSASPLLGIRQWQNSDLTERSYTQTYSGVRTEDALDRLRLDESTLKRMRQEIYREAYGEEPADTPRDMLKPNELPGGQSLISNRPLNDAVVSTPAMGLTAPGGALRSLVPPTQQSSQYAELRKKLDDYYSQRLSEDRPQYGDVLEQIRNREEREAIRTGSGPTSRPTGIEAFGLPNYAKISRELVTGKTLKDSSDRVGRPAPVKITSLASGVKATALNQFLKRAEDLMREGKFSSALDQYDAAEQVAPNNPLVWLGRANAELGAGYYTKAETHLRQALSSDPTLLMGQYDLKLMIGQDRLAEVIKDLKQVATDNPQQGRPLFLLAFIYYNAGNAKQAATYLDLAVQRSGGKDLVVDVIREHWSLAEAPATRPAD